MSFLCDLLCFMWLEKINVKYIRAHEGYLDRKVIEILFKGKIFFLPFSEKIDRACLKLIG